MHRFPALTSILITGALALATPAITAAQQGRTAPQARSAADSLAVTATVERFHRALATADSAGALALLTPDVQVLESGGVETLAEYRSHHLSSDIGFARAVTSERTVRQVRVRGDVAWIASTSTARGTYRMREINSAGAELMVLVRTPAGWRISAIHWSSR
ncbi:MAG TPA: nuclear transport factor 2 family protein [Longimicrobium sp.]|nr:nuclear transport factor 2 family protein [Longimicrobium sp.]